MWPAESGGQMKTYRIPEVCPELGRGGEQHRFSYLLVHISYNDKLHGLWSLGLYTELAKPDLLVCSR
jgi:hypothetical protein